MILSTLLYICHALILLTWWSFKNCYHKKRIHSSYFLKSRIQDTGEAQGKLNALVGVMIRDDDHIIKALYITTRSGKRGRQPQPMTWIQIIKMTWQRIIQQKREPTIVRGGAKLLGELTHVNWDRIQVKGEAISLNLLLSAHCHPTRRETNEDWFRKCFWVFPSGFSQ